MCSDTPPILEQLAVIRPADRSGATAANRFQFQLSWALCRLLELHSTAQEYAIILDYHDDVLELDHEITPSRIDFHQVKSKSGGTWTTKSLLKRPAGKTGAKSSILGKLIQHCTTFGKHTRLTCFISNRPVNLPLQGNKKPDEVEQFSLADAADSARKTVLDALKKECKVELSDEMAANLRFVITPLAPDDHENQTRGRLATFLETHADPAVATNPVYKSLRAELQRRNNDERLPIAARDLSKQRVFGRSHMIQILDLAKPQKSIHEFLAAIVTNLTAESVPFALRQSLRGRCERIYAQRLDPTNALLLNVSSEIETSYIEWLSRPNSSGALLDGLEIVRQAIEPKLYANFVAAYQVQHFDALYLVVTHDLKSLPPTAAKSSDETS